MKKRKLYKRKETHILITISGLIISGVIFLFSNFIEAKRFTPEASYQVCFTPYKNCTTLITHAIQEAKERIHMQAYGLTSKPIIEALRSAAKRGIEVKLILDKSHLLQPEVANFLVKNHISVWIDKPTGIAHNKVLIIDQAQVVTGSFNWTYSAQHRNAENVLFIKDSELTQSYLNNWVRRCDQSMPFKGSKHQAHASTKTRHSDHAFWTTQINKLINAFLAYT